MDDDSRQVPEEACWWRLRLRRNPETGYVYLIQTDGHDEPWAGYLEYYDGRDDWTFPYRWQTNVARKFEDIMASPDPYGFGPPIEHVRTIITGQIYYLDVLDVTPPHWPDVCVLDKYMWRKLTDDGWHPGPPDYDTSELVEIQGDLVRVVG
ncbi:hypothetical protein SEA_NANOSMITE_94 [Mycobacterium phage Nanosmite]|nr:hypothetical protein SEA_NANOSMITE_94 [Mycobacterium phage Nanosmite]